MPAAVWRFVRVVPAGALEDPELLPEDPVPEPDPELPLEPLEPEPLLLPEELPLEEPVDPEDEPELPALPEPDPEPLDEPLLEPPEDPALPEDPELLPDPELLDPELLPEEPEPEEPEPALPEDPEPLPDPELLPLPDELPDDPELPLEPELPEDPEAPDDPEVPEDPDAPPLDPLELDPLLPEPALPLFEPELAPGSVPELPLEEPALAPEAVPAAVALAVSVMTIDPQPERKREMLPPSSVTRRPPAKLPAAEGREAAPTVRRRKDIPEKANMEKSALRRGIDPAGRWAGLSADNVRRRLDNLFQRISCVQRQISGQVLRGTRRPPERRAMTQTALAATKVGEQTRRDSGTTELRRINWTDHTKIVTSVQDVFGNFCPESCKSP